MLRININVLLNGVELHGDFKCVALLPVKFTSEMCDLYDNRTGICKLN